MDQLLSRIADPLKAPLDPANRLYWVYLAGALAVATATWLLAARGAKTVPTPDDRPPTLLEYLFPKAVFWHPSARLDYLYFIVNRGLFAALLAPALAIAVPLASIASASIVATVAPELTLDLLGGTSGSVLLTLATAIALDFGLWVGHYLMHRSPLLWEFHKIHHSAEVLTPVTVYRQHPVDDMVNLSLSGLCVGLVLGVFEQVATAPPDLVTVLSLNAVLFAYYVAAYNLRHSHIRLSYGRRVEHFLVSPAQHHVHHSVDVADHDRNFGFMFAVWDWMFGTLKTAETPRRIAFGLEPGGTRGYESIAKLYAEPFRRIHGTRKGRLLGASLVGTMIGAVFLSLMLLFAPATRPALVGPLADARAIEPTVAAPSSVRLDDLTSPEVAALVAGGYRIALVPTGGTEQNGAHMVLGKHNRIVEIAAERIARGLGNALVAPVIAYVPEGDIERRSGHMAHAGTLSVPQSTFESVLEHAAASLRAHGFQLIAFVGDSGGNQSGQAAVADRLNRRWGGRRAVVLHVDRYYDVQGSNRLLRDHGASDDAIGTHAGIRDTAELMAVSPSGIRERLLATPGAGADGEPSRATPAIGRALLEARIGAAVTQIRDEWRAIHDPRRGSAATAGGSRALPAP